MRVVLPAVTALLAAASTLSIACGGAPTPEDDESLGAATRASRAPGFAENGAPGKAPVTTGDCTDTSEGCSCEAGSESVSCWSGDAALRGKAGCKDGTRQCLRSGEFTKWGPCEGEITACTAIPPVSSVPDYAGCAALPTSGKRGYGMCGADEAVVIVNDGRSQEMTCCPIGKNVLSALPAEQHVSRTGLCLADEVATGMTNPNGGTLCTKINTQFLKLSAQVNAQYVNGNVPGVLGQIAKAYNVSDACICPEGTVVVGGHTSRDNQCSDKCARIERR